MGAVLQKVSVEGKGSRAPQGLADARETTRAGTGSARAQGERPSVRRSPMAVDFPCLCELRGGDRGASRSGAELRRREEYFPFEVTGNRGYPSWASRRRPWLRCHGRTEPAPTRGAPLVERCPCFATLPLFCFGSLGRVRRLRPPPPRSRTGLGLCREVEEFWWNRI